MLEKLDDRTGLGRVVRAGRRGGGMILGEQCSERKAGETGSYDRDPTSGQAPRGSAG